MTEIRSRVLLAGLTALLAGFALVNMVVDRRALAQGGRELSWWSGLALDVAVPIQKFVAMPFERARRLERLRGADRRAPREHRFAREARRDRGREPPAPRGAARERAARSDRRDARGVRRPDGTRGAGGPRRVDLVPLGAARPRAQ